MPYFTNSIAPLAFITFAGILTAAQAPPPSPEAQLATMKQYCTGCHNDKAKLGGASFENITAASVAKNAPRWIRALKKYGYWPKASAESTTAAAAS